MTIQHAIEIASGSVALGQAARSGRGLVAATPNGTVEHVITSGRPRFAEVDQIVLPRKTLSQRRWIGTLAPGQSDQLMRCVRVIAATEMIFISPAKAAAWLRRPTTALAGDTPLSLLDTPEGVLFVEDLLARIDQGLAV